MSALISSHRLIVVYVQTSLDCESWTRPVELYASKILHVSIDLILLEHLRREICHVAL